MRRRRCWQKGDAEHGPVRTSHERAHWLSEKCCRLVGHIVDEVWIMPADGAKQGMQEIVTTSERAREEELERARDGIFQAGQQRMTPGGRDNGWAATDI